MSTAQSFQLTVAHRAQQQRISAGVARQVLSVWGIVDPAQIEASWPFVSQTIAQIIGTGYAASSAASAAYLQGHALLNGADVTVSAPPPLNVEQVATSLRVTGPVAVKIASAAGMTPQNAASSALVQITGSSTRLALAGGRRTILETSQRADAIVGYRRVGDGHSCSFCDMLISRGAVYKGAKEAVSVGDRPRGTQRVGASYHDHCHCFAEPLYSSEAEPADVAAAVQRYVNGRQ